MSNETDNRPKEDVIIEDKGREETDKKETIDKPWLFKAGQSGNPKGRPKGQGLSITSEIKRELAKVPKGDKANKLSQLIKVIFDKALIDKDEKTISKIWAYVDGLPRQQTDIKLDQNVQVNVMNYGDPLSLIGEKREVIQVIEAKEVGQ